MSAAAPAAKKAEQLSPMATASRRPDDVEAREDGSRRRGQREEVVPRAATSSPAVILGISRLLKLQCPVPVVLNRVLQQHS